MRVRAMHGSHPETSGRESMPANASPRSCTTHFRIWAFSPTDNVLRSFSDSFRVAMGNDFIASEVQRLVEFEPVVIIV
jgi:hypothetical protein